MPVSNVASGQLTYANAGANLVVATPTLAPGATYTTQPFLEMPNLDRLTWHVEITLGTGILLVQPEVAFRRGVAQNLIFVNALPAVLTPAAGQPLVLTLNTLVVQAMRMTVVHTGVPGDPDITAEIRLSASA